MTMTQAFQNAATRTIQVKDTSMVYRELGERGGVPVVFLHHLTAVLDDWDPKVLDGIAGSHHVVIFDNRGVGGSGGQTPVSVADMAEDAIAFIEALGFAQVDLFGFSLGGFVAQVIAQTRPELVRKIVLAGTGPAGGVGISDVGTILQGAFQKAGAEHKHPKHFLFFSPSPQSQKAADAFLQRLGERQADRDTAVSDQTVQAQLTAIAKWGQAPGADGEFNRAVRSPSQCEARHLPGCEPWRHLPIRRRLRRSDAPLSRGIATHCASRILPRAESKICSLGKYVRIPCRRASRELLGAMSKMISIQIWLEKYYAPLESLSPRWRLLSSG